MAYYSGSASSFTDLLEALQDACVSEGWTLSGDVLHKDGCYARVKKLDGHVDYAGAWDALEIKGGTGIDGSNELTTASPKVFYMQQVAQNTAITFPVAYEINILDAPDEVYFSVKYATDSFMHLAFGKSPWVDSAGTGNWFYASSPYRGYENGNPYNRFVLCSPAGYSLNGSPVLPFWGTYRNEFNLLSDVHIDLDGYEWESEKIASTYYISSGGVDHGIQPAFEYQPNAASGDSMLFPAHIFAYRGDVGAPNHEANMSIVASIKHLRFLRIDNYEPGEIIQNGSDYWKVYPACRKDLTDRSPASANLIGNTGTQGFAVRYTGTV